MQVILARPLPCVAHDNNMVILKMYGWKNTNPRSNGFCNLVGRGDPPPIRSRQMCVKYSNKKLCVL